MDGKIVVPEGMLKAAHSVTHRIAEHDTITASLEAALLWLSENPIAPTDEQCSEMIYRFGLEGPAHGSSEGPPRISKLQAHDLVVNWQRRMFLAPEPEVHTNPELDVCPLCACPSENLSPAWDRETGRLTRLTCTHCKVAFYPAGDRDLAPMWNLRQKNHDVCEVCHPRREPEVPEEIKDLLYPDLVNAIDVVTGNALPTRTEDRFQKAV